MPSETLAIPPATNAKGYRKYPLEQLEVGESFFVRMPFGATAFTRKRFQSAVLMAAWKIRASGKRFTSRRVDGGIRVWRIE